MTDLTGKVYGMLTVISKSENIGRNTAWNCVCKCGKETKSLAYNLIGGKSKSCGCIRGNKLGKLAQTHGESRTRLYKLYKGIRQRCLNVNSPAYKYYGGKGIVLCDEWLNDFLKFKEWCICNQYTDEKTIDRIDPNGNYEPSNCRWVSFEKQQNNKLNSFFLTIDNNTKTIAEWAKHNGINKQTLYSKFYRLFKELNLIDSNLELIIKTKNVN